MKRVKGLLNRKAAVVGAAGAAVVAGASQAHAAWTVDLTGITTDITAIGTSLLALAVVIFGFRVARGMVKR